MNDARIELAIARRLIARPQSLEVCAAAIAVKFGVPTHRTARLIDALLDRRELLKHGELLMLNFGRPAGEAMDAHCGRQLGDVQDLVRAHEFTQTLARIRRNLEGRLE